jgi:hypothetical protein
MKMRKTLIAILIALALVVIPVGSALAATTADVTVTATPTFISITNSPDSYDFGVVTESSTPNTGETHFTITNGSTVPIDITIGCNGWSGAAHSWNYGASGADTGQLNASDGSGGYDITVPSGSTTALHSNVAKGNNPQWGLELEAPSSFGFGDEQTTTVTISASQHS